MLPRTPSMQPVLGKLSLYKVVTHTIRSGGIFSGERFWLTYGGQRLASFLVALSLFSLDKSHPQDGWISFIARFFFFSFALLHYAVMVPTMAAQGKGHLTDSQFCAEMITHESRLMYYYFPVLIWYLWQWRMLIAIELVCVVCAYLLWAKVNPEGAERYLKSLPARLRDFWIAKASPLVSVRGAFLFLVDRYHFIIYATQIAQLRAKRQQQLGDSQAPIAENPYEYQELRSERHIRLLRLFKKRWEDRGNELRGELVQYPISIAPKYTALSYTWGSSRPSSPIKTPWGKDIIISNTVEDFLYYRHSMRQDEFFWIDAICIDQLNFKEKKVQIPLMAQIYQKATQTVVWLGPPSTPGIAGHVRNVILDDAILKTGGYDTDNGTSAFLRPEYMTKGNSVFTEIGCLLANPWFTRKWIIQELAVSKEVIVLYNGVRLGWDSISMLNSSISDEMTRTCILMSFFSSMIQGQVHITGQYLDALEINSVQRNIDILDGIRSARQQQKGLPLHEALEFTASFKCSVPLDKAYAISGLLGSESKIESAGDYRLRPATLSRNVADQMLCSEGWFDNLRMSTWYFSERTKKPEYLRLPSWMIDFKLELNFPGEIMFGSRWIDPGQRSLVDDSGCARKTYNRDIIQLQAKSVGLISEINNSSILADTFTRDAVPVLPGQWEEWTRSDQGMQQASRHKMRRWYLSNQSFTRERLCRETSCSTEEANQQFWEAFLHNISHIPQGFRRYSGSNNNPRRNWKSPIARRLFERALVWGNGDIMSNQLAGVEGEGGMMYHDLGDGDIVSVADIFLDLFAYFTKAYGSKKFCSTSNGMLAIVPACTKEGDIIVHIRGGYMPAIFRRSKKNMDTQDGRLVELVGFCYVHDVPDVYSGNDWDDWFVE